MRRLIFWIPLVLVVLTVIVLASLPFLIHSDYVEGLINQAIKQQTAYSASFDRIQLSYFPMPLVHVENVELTPQKGADLPLIHAERVNLRPSIFSILIGRPSLAHGNIKGADIHQTLRDPNFVKTISLKDATIDFWNIASNRPVRFKIKGKFLSDSENVSLSGSVKSNFEYFKTKDLSGKVQALVGPVELKRLADWWGAPLPIQVDKGTFSFSTQITKLEGTPNLDFSGTANIEKLVYQIPPKPNSAAPGDYALNFNTSLDLDAGVLDIKKGTLSTPFGGPFELDGSANVLTGSLNEILIKTESLRPEILPQYVLSLEQVLPVNLGFSGETQLDFYLKGEPELFTINFGIDFTHTNLAYSKYFSKPTGIPLTFTSDMKLAGGRALRGDFSMEFEQAVLKGSLVGVDLQSGQGEMTILTNKFSINGWEKYFPLLRQFALSGAIKVLTSIKGNFNHLNEARMMHNITLESLHARAENGAEIKNLSGSLDSGPLDSELKDFQFEIGNTPFSVEGKMFQQPEAKWLIDIRAPKIDVADLVSHVARAAQAIDAEGKTDWRSLENSVRQFFTPTEVVEQFESQIAFGGKQFLIPQLKFNVFGGTVSGRAAFDELSKVPASFIEFDVERLSLSRMQSSITQPVMLGNLFLHANLTEQGPMDSGWLDRLGGKGSVSVTNGELHTLDLLGGLGQIAQLAPLDSLKSGVTRFDDIRADFEVLNQKITTQNAVMLSEDFQVEGQGDVTFGGILNFRLSTYLSPALSQRISPRIGENVRLGPIPILIVGPVAQPQVRQDPMLIASFLQSLVQEQFAKITSRFLPTQNQKDSSQSGTGSSASTAANQEGQPKSQESQNLDEQLVQSGFSLLEHFLSKDKSSSSQN